MTDLVHATRAVEVVNPFTGELLALDAETDVLARYLANVREAEVQLRACKRLVSDEILSRLDKQARWTLHLPGLKVTGQSPAPDEEWNGGELHEALLALVDDGLLSIEAVDAAVETVVSYKPRKSGITALRKLGGRVAEVVDSLCRVSERERRVHVTASGG